MKVLILADNEEMEVVQSSIASFQSAARRVSPIFYDIVKGATHTHTHKTTGVISISMESDAVTIFPELVRSILSSATNFFDVREKLAGCRQILFGKIEEVEKSIQEPEKHEPTPEAKPMPKVNFPPLKYPKEVRDKVEASRRKGMTYKKIAETYGMSISTAQKIAMERGVA